MFKEMGSQRCHERARPLKPKAGCQEAETTLNPERPFRALFWGPKRALQPEPYTLNLGKRGGTLPSNRSIPRVWRGCQPLPALLSDLSAFRLFSKMEMRKMPLGDAYALKEPLRVSMAPKTPPKKHPKKAAF